MISLMVETIIIRKKGYIATSNNMEVCLDTIAV